MIAADGCGFDRMVAKKMVLGAMTFQTNKVL